MSREWKPGDVAMLGSFVSLRVKYNPVGCPSTHAHDGDHWHRASGDWVIDGGGPSPHPLVVIDPEDRAQMERLLDAHNKAERDAACKGGECGSGSCWIDIMRNTLREFANPTPPKPDEPTGLGAVVATDEDGDYVRVSVERDRPWHNVQTGSLWHWDAVAAVRVLSEGVTP